MGTYVMPFANQRFGFPAFNNNFGNNPSPMFSQMGHNCFMQQNNYNNSFNNNFFQANFPQFNSFNNRGNTTVTNIYNNYFSSPCMSQPMIMQGQMMNGYASANMGYNNPSLMQGQIINPGYGYPSLMQGQIINPGYGYPSLMQGQIINPYAQTNNSSISIQSLLNLLQLLPLLNKQPVVVDTEQTVVEDASAWGDPHYTATGADGKTKINFIHDGKTGDTYNVFEGDGYEVQGKYGLAGHKINKILDTHIKAGIDDIQYTVDGKTKINGKEIKDGTTVTLADGTKVTKKGSNMILESKEGDAKLNFRNNDGICVDPTGKFSGLDGILGTAIKENRNLSESESNKFTLATA